MNKAVMVSLVGWLTLGAAHGEVPSPVEALPYAVGTGYFGEALDTTLVSLKTAKSLPDYRILPGVPLTVELWCRVNAASGYDVLVANELKESTAHWQIYSDPAGFPVLYVPGMEPSTLVVTPPHREGKNVLYKQWRHIAMVWDGETAALFVDGGEVAREKLTAKQHPGAPVEGPLMIGHLLDGDDAVGCSAMIDEIRISRAAIPMRKLRKENPYDRMGPDGEAKWTTDHSYFRPFAVEQSTVGLWRFDPGPEMSRFLRDESANANHLILSSGSNVSKSEIDRAAYKALAGPGPLDSEPERIVLASGAAEVPGIRPVYSLDGEWQMVQADHLVIGDEGAWAAAMPAQVPGSVHTALFQNGVIPDPYFGKNQEEVAPWSDKGYYFRKIFSGPPDGQDETLVFEGVCNKTTIWLNGEKLGDHEGMMIPIVYPVKDRLREQNTLIVKLHPAIVWSKTVVFNNSYGWHYAKFPPLGIWQPVYMSGEPAVKIDHPFIATRDVESGTMDLVAEMTGPSQGWSGELVGVIEPDNFAGEAHHFKKRVRASGSAHKQHLRFDIPDPQLWWPVDMGDPNLYRLRLAFVPDGGGRADTHDVTFGIRTVEKRPVAGRKHHNVFDWTFVINGRPMFVKGTGWCTPDAMMDFSRERYERFIALAADQHIQMLRAWGGGLVETDDFYDLCNRYGIMVLQEWPTCWGSHDRQPYGMLEETVRAGTLRLRNHPSLVLVGAGNESYPSIGEAIDMMGRLAIELDDTREFHRGQPDGGSQHDYSFYWASKHIDSALQMTSLFWGEYGVASFPDYESVMRYMPEDEKELWPVTKEMDKSFTYHTPTFNKRDWDCLSHVAGYFTEGKTMGDFIWGTQMAQAVGVRHTLERARSRWPYTTGALYYKMNDNCPAASWATVDWYGAPKPAHYLIKHSFAPLVAVAIQDHSYVYGSELKAPVFLLDDAEALDGKNWDVQITAYGADLKPVAERKWSGSGSAGRVKPLGDFSLNKEQTKHAPLFFVLDVLVDGALAQRNYHFINFEKEKDCLLRLPKGTVSMKTGGGELVTLSNTGNIPAVGVEIRRPGHQDTFTADDNYIWLNPGESRTINVNTTEGLTVEGWNL